MEPAMTPTDTGMGVWIVVLTFDVSRVRGTITRLVVVMKMTAGAGSGEKEGAEGSTARARDDLRKLRRMRKNLADDAQAYAVVDDFSLALFADDAMGRYMRIARGASAVVDGIYLALHADGATVNYISSALNVTSIPDYVTMVSISGGPACNAEAACPGGTRLAAASNPRCGSGRRPTPGHATSRNSVRDACSSSTPRRPKRDSGELGWLAVAATQVPTDGAGRTAIN
jgi:hypothetical protein